MSNAFRGMAVIGVLTIAACAAVSQQKSIATQADSSEFHNLRVLPPNITHDELIATMRGFARALGVKCNHCHVRNPPGSKEEFEFPSDAKPEKRAARTMLRMVRNINSNYINRLNEHDQTVGCVTCHRGHTVPEIALAPLPPRPPRPGEPPAEAPPEAQPPPAPQPPPI